MADGETFMGGESCYKSKNITMCRDGKYRWVYELNLYKSTAVFSEVWKVLGISILITVLLIGGISVLDNDFMDVLQSMAEIAGIMLLIFIPLSIVGYLLFANMSGGKYCVLFEMDEKGINHAQQEKQVKKAALLGAITAVAGMASGNPGTIGSGILAASRTSMYSGFESVKELEFLPKQHLIRVNEALSRNQVYAEDEDFTFVADYIKARCINAKVKE